MIENDYKSKCQFLGIDYQNAIKKRLALTLIPIFLAPPLVFLGDYYLAFLVLIIGVIFYKYDYIILRRKYRVKVINRQLEFANFFSYLIIFLQRKMNLFQALGFSEDYLDNDFHLLVSDFRQAINENNSIAPYLDFAENFESDAIMEILIILYQYEKNGCSEVDLNNFSNSLQRLHDNEVDEYLNISIRNYDYHAFLPLLASAIIATAFALTILSNIGGFLNV